MMVFHVLGEVNFLGRCPGPVARQLDQAASCAVTGSGEDAVVVIDGSGAVGCAIVRLIVTPQKFAVLRSDADDALTAVLQTGPSSGTLTLNDDGSFDYTPAAAFVGVDVTGSEIDGLNRRYGVLQDPAVLVLRPPGDLIVRIDGFADRDTVAQAAANASS